MSSDKKPPRKKFIAELTDDDLYCDKPPVEADASDVDAKVDDVPTVDDKPTIQSAVDDKPTVDETRRKTFHSKNFADDASTADKPHVEADMSDVDAKVADVPTVDDKPTIQSAVDDKPHVDETRRKTFYSKNFADDASTADKPHVEADMSDVDAKVDDVPTVDDKPTIQSAVDDKPHVDETRRKTFYSKNFADDASTADKPEGKRKISHAEASGILISVVMLGYSLVTEDKPLFFLSTALLIFLLRPIIGGLFGKHSQTVQNGLHAFSIVLFVGALMFLFF